MPLNLLSEIFSCKIFCTNENIIKPECFRYSINIIDNEIKAEDNTVTRSANIGDQMCAPILCGEQKLINKVHQELITVAIISINNR